MTPSIETTQIRWRAAAPTAVLPAVANGRELELAPRHVGGAYQRVVKPILDRLLGAVLLAVLLPVVAITAAIVAWSLGAPVLLRQRRIGLHGRPFLMYKFRTMLPDRRLGDRRQQLREQATDRRMTHKSDADPRHTRIGRFLRKWSLDELPQLLNVLKGDMSLVGPRPELAHVVGKYEPWQHSRHVVRPGLTGLWQVTERGGGAPMQDHVDVDLRYISEVSLAADLRILLLTVPAALGLRKGS